MPIDAETAAELGITLEHPLVADTEIDLNDPAMQELIKSFEATAPTAREIADQIAREQETPDDSDPTTPDLEATGEAATGEPATGDPANDGTGEPDPKPAPEVAAPAPTTLSDEDQKRLLGLDQWARSLRPEVVTAFDAIESGRAVALPREDFEAYLAWKANGSKPAPAANAPIGQTLDDDELYADPATRALRDEIQSLRASIDQQRQDSINTQAASITAQQQAHIATREHTFETTFTTYAAEQGLTPAELNAALSHAINTNLILNVDRELGQFSPTGNLIEEADPAQVARVTLDRAIYAIPELRQRAIDLEVARRLETERADIMATNAKRNRAGSLSSAPTAATAPDPVDVRKMTPYETDAAIAAELRRTTSV